MPEGGKVPDYRRMYYVLCAGISSLLDDMQERRELDSTYQRLETLLHEAEDIYIDTADVIWMEDHPSAGETKDK